MVKHEDERAFPVSVDMGNGQSATNLGMTLRDYFAAKAIPALIARNFDESQAAEVAYDYADAMLAERSKP